MITAACIKRLCRLWFSILACAVTVAQGAIYDIVLNDAPNRSLRLNIPDSLTVVRGIIIYGNGANGDSRGMATNAELVALAEPFGFAVMGTSRWYNFSDRFDANEFSIFEARLQEFATMSGHPELVVAPCLPIGHSNGGQMSFGFNTLRPDKVIAIVASKGAFYNSVRPGLDALHTPGVLVAGEIDPGLGTAAIRDLFFGNRPRGALWSWVEDQGVDHAQGNSNELTRPFVEAMLWARYPAGASPANGPVSLLAMTEPDGWLTDADSYKTGLADIAPYAVYTKDRSVAGWLPSRRMAYIFRAFASYNKASTTATLSSGAGPVDWNTAVTYTIGEPSAAWATIEFYEGDRLLRSVNPGDNNPLSLTTTPATPGYSVFHALVTFADGTRRTTIPRRVYMRAGSPLAPAVSSITMLPDAVGPGSTVTLTASVTGSPLATHRWQKDGVALTNGGNISGVTHTTLTLSNLQPGDAGSYTLVATNTVASATSAPWVLTFTDAPSVVITQPETRTVPAGTNATFTVGVGGYPSPICQWQRLPAGSSTWINLTNGGSYAGTASATLTVRSSTAAMSDDQFRCVLTNSLGSTTSNAATLTVSGASTPPFQYPVGIARDSAGNLYVTDAATNLIRKITPAGIVSTLAGTPNVTGSQDGVGGAARFNSPGALAVDSAGNLYVADTGNATLRRIDSTGTVTTVAGSATIRGSADGTGANALFNQPSGIAIDSSGNLYVADTGNATLRRVTPAGVVTTLAGTAGNRGEADGTGGAARFNCLVGVVVDLTGNLLVADTYNNTIRRVTPAGVVTTLAGSAGLAGSNDGTGIDALFNQPVGLAADATGSLYVADTANNTLRQIVPVGVVTTVAGVAGIAGLADGASNAALFNQPHGVATDGAGNLWVADTGNGVIRLVAVNGVVSTPVYTESTSGGSSSGSTPPGNSSSEAGASGGGGAASVWFSGLLALLAATRLGRNGRRHPPAL